MVEVMETLDSGTTGTGFTKIGWPAFHATRRGGVSTPPGDKATEENHDGQ